MKKRLSTFILLLIFFIGLSVLLYPAISNYWNSKTQSQAIVDYEKAMEDLQQEDYSAVFEQAERYNQQLSEVDFPLMDYEQVEGYDSILDLNGNGMMGYLKIEKIGVELPIYHGTEESVLNVAAGHVEGSSLPIGGESTHAVISAHRGLPSAKLFTNLDRMEIGDTFTITILDRVLTYEVDKIQIVEPSEVDGLLIEDGEDYCTLLTCTPYAINTHRLLVRGRRIETVEHKTIHMIVLFKPVKKEQTGDDLL